MKREPVPGSFTIIFHTDFSGEHLQQPQTLNKFLPLCNSHFVEFGYLREQKRTGKWKIR